MLVRDVMATRVLSAGRTGPLKDVVALMLENRIGGVPVLDERCRVVGIVTGSDLRPDLHPEKPGATGGPCRVVADVMTQSVITLSEEDTVTEAARVLFRHGIKRAPVLRQGILVGMITRSDLLRPYLRTDSEIRADVEEILFAQEIGLIPQAIAIEVEGGIVGLTGVVADRRQAATAVQLARGVEGAIDVVDELEVISTPDPRFGRRIDGRRPQPVPRDGGDTTPKGRVLLVEPDARNRDIYGSWLEDCGYEVVACPGPSSPDYTCIGGRTGGCPLVEPADVVVLHLELDSDLERQGTSALELLALYSGSGRPVVVFGSDPLMSEDLLLDGAGEVLVGQPTSEELIGAVGRFIEAPVSARVG